MDPVSIFSKVLNHVHGEDGGHSIQRSDEDSDLTYPDCQQQTPGGLTVSLPMTKDLRDTEITREREKKKCKNTIINMSYNQGQTAQ